MILQSEISPELWSAISSQYEAENYSDAILSALHHLRDMIRDVANLDSDGAPLIGQAFGGNSPRLRINRFETDTQKDEQRGFEQLLRGLYQGIRNPRTHERMEDKKQTADAIIVFVDYVIGVIGKAKGPFILEEWMNRVFDPDFVRSDRYAQHFEKLTNESAKNLWIDAICKAVSTPMGSVVIREKLAEAFYRFPDDWRNLILGKLKPFQETDPEYYASLVNFEEGEIPF